MRRERVEQAYATRSVHGSDPSGLFRGRLWQVAEIQKGKNEDADTGQRGDGI